jgi:patatin-like phospholipase/acyl hydrolase
MSTFKILSIDGGGIRGLVAAVIVSRLDMECPKFLESIDMFAGTSTGAIVAAGLANGISPQQLVEVYATCGKRVFDRNMKNLFGLVGSRYKNSGLKKILASLFGARRLGDLSKKIMIPTFCLKSNEEPRRWRPKFFHNFNHDGDCSQFVCDVVLQSCSAPTYFPAHNGYIDGGMVANNPSMAALCQAIDVRYGNGVKLDDISLLSVGTGESSRFIRDPDYSFGLFDVSKILDIVLGGTESVPDYQCGVLLGDRYVRIDPLDTRDVKMDDYGKVGYLRRIAVDYDLNQCEKWIRRNWQ